MKVGEDEDFIYLDDAGYESTRLWLPIGGLVVAIILAMLYPLYRANIREYFKMPTCSAPEYDAYTAKAASDFCRSYRGEKATFYIVGHQVFSGTPPKVVTLAIVCPDTEKR